MTTRYVTVRLTEKEAEAILVRANSGSYEYDHDDYPEIAGPSERAEKKIRAALGGRKKSDEDELSMEMEEEEVRSREWAIRKMAPELEVALKAAHRIILAALPTHVPAHVWNNNWPVVDEIMNKLEEL